MTITLRGQPQREWNGNVPNPKRLLHRSIHMPLGARETPAGTQEGREDLEALERKLAG